MIFYHLNKMYLVIIVLFILSGIFQGCGKFNTSTGSAPSLSATEPAIAPAPEPQALPSPDQALKPVYSPESDLSIYETNKEGQPLLVVNKIENVKFGMSFKEAEKFIKACNAFDHPTYKPLGIVKMIECQNGYSLEFVDDRLEEIIFTEAFNTEVPLKPFANKYWNPPNKMRLRMPIKEYRALETEWKNTLIKAGFKQLFYAPDNDEEKKARSFYFFELYPNDQENAFVRIHFGPFIDNFQASWVFEFAGKGNNQTLKSVTATYNIYNLNWNIEFQK